MHAFPALLALTPPKLVVSLAQDLCSLGLYYVSQVFWLFSRGSLFAVIMLIAKGWTITRSSLPVFDARLLGSAVTTYIVALAFSRVVEQTVDIMRLVYLIFLLLMYICVIRLVFVNVDQNLRILKHQLFLVRQAFIDPASTPAWTKFIMYRVFHRCIFAFIFIEVTIQVLQNILVDVNFWIFRMSDELVFLYVTTGITVTFRTCRMNDYFEDAVAQLVEDGVMDTPGGDNAASSVGPAHWQPGLALPAAPRHVCDVPEVQVPTVVVVENPATEGDDGTLYPCVGVGTVLPYGKKEEEDGPLRRGPGPLLPSEDVPASVAIVHTRSPAASRHANDVDEQSRAVDARARPVQNLRHVGSASSSPAAPDSSSETS